MRLLALDQAAKVTGYTVFDGGEVIACGKMEVKPTMDMEKRLRKFADNLSELDSEYHFDRIAFEDIQMQMGNVSTYKVLAYIQAVIILWCEEKKIPYQILAPSHWRSIIKTNYGVAFGRKRAEQKAAALAFAQESTNGEIKEMTEDMADSYCLGLAAIESMKHNEGAAF